MTSVSELPTDIDAHPVDIHVGAQLRRARLLAGLSQGQVATSAKISFQQLQKYERGVNRISASRLFEIAAILCVPVSYFFEGTAGEFSPARSATESAPVGMDEGLTAGRREIIELVRAYMAINSRNVRNAVRTLLEELAKGEPVRTANA